MPRSYARSTEPPLYDAEVAESLHEPFVRPAGLSYREQFVECDAARLAFDEVENAAYSSRSAIGSSPTTAAWSDVPSCSKNRRLRRPSGSRSHFDENPPRHVPPPWSRVDGASAAPSARPT